MPVRFAKPASGAELFRLTIGELLPGASATAEIVFRDERRFSYSDLRDRIGRLAEVLAGLGVEEGSTVGVLDWDSHRYLELYFAVPMMGAVLQTVNIRLAPAQVAYTIDHAGAEVLLVHHDFLPLIDKLAPDLPKVRAIVALGDVAPADAAGTQGDYEALLAGAARNYSFPVFDENAIATTFYTTGTTGLPKAVCFSHRQIVLHTLAVAAAVAARRPTGLGYADVYMPITPMFHVHAWGFPYVATMLGLKQVYPGRYEPDRLLDFRRREGVTISHGVPTVLTMLLDAAERTGERVDGWTMVVGGAALTADLAERANRIGLIVIAGYGMSETGPVVAIAAAPKPGQADMDAATRAGTPIPLVSVRVVDEEMRRVPADGASQGELVVRSPWLTPCYADDPVASEKLWTNGWLRTGDVATIGAEGGVHIRDRLKDVIKSGGEWICSLTLEELVSEDPRVREVAIVSAPDPHWGERPVAFLVATDDGVPGVEDLNAILRSAAAAGRISRYALLERIVVLSAIPRTSVGKQDKKALRAIL